MKKQLVAALIGVNMSAVAQAATPSMEEMWQLIQQQQSEIAALKSQLNKSCLLYTSPSPRDRQKSRMPSSA